jgi:hypothetical protein
MAKRPVNKTCVYCCNRPATTWDHVFARSFMPVARRANLPKVPACEQCNNEKSKLENELAAILPFGGRHTDARQHLTTAVPGMLAQNLRLHRELQEGASTNWVLNEKGTFDLAPSVPVAGDMVERLCAYIARGLAWKHWHVRFGSDCAVAAFVLAPKLGETMFNAILHTGSTHRANGDFGDGAFVYEGTQSADDPSLSAWIFSIYGGATFAASDLAEGLASKIGVLTGRREFIEQYTRNWT